MKTFLQPSNLWCIEETEIIAENGKHFEGAFAQGSGYLQIRGSYEEGLLCAPQNEEYMRLPANVTIEKPRHPRSKCGVYVPGITGVHPLLREEIVNLPFFAALCVKLNSQALDMDTSGIKSYSRVLDMRDGVLYRSFLWQEKSAELQCSYRRFVSKAVPNLLVIEAEFTANEDLTLEIISEIDINVRTNGFNHFKEASSFEQSGISAAHIVTDNNDFVDMACALFVNNACAPISENKQAFTLKLKKGEAAFVQKFCAVSTSRDADKTSLTQLAGLVKGCAEKTDIYQKHAELWAEMWKKSEVTIKGDDEAARAVNFSVYHLLRCANPYDNRVAVCAKGFAGEAYFGHFFWDTEIYMLPFYLYTQPNTAKALTEFRINTLSGAKRNAAAYGYNGAKYAWESSVSGDEQCPNWQYCDNEVHINADVVFGLWHYYSATADKEFLKRCLPVFAETTRYWLSRVYFDNSGNVSLNGVMGPDEYICSCSDNAYTNTMVKKAVEYTFKAFNICGENSLLTQEETEKARLMIEKLPVLRDENGVVLQCRGFDEFEELNFDEIWPDKAKHFGAVISQERNYRSKALKQADVLMLPYLYPQEYKAEEISKIYEKYIPYTTHDSSLSYIIHSIIKARLNEGDEAYSLFKKALSIDMDYGAAEGIHIANCGGIWQGVIMGFAGLQPVYSGEASACPVLKPALPKHWHELSFPLIYNGKAYKISINQSGCEIKENN